MLRPTKQTLRPNRIALSITCCMRLRLLANMATITRPAAFLNWFTKVSPIFFSLMVYPGRSMLVLSHSRQSTPLLPTSDRLIRSVTSPSTGV